MLDEYDSETLSNFEPWLELIAMYRQMRKMLPDGYVREAAATATHGTGGGEQQEMDVGPDSAK